MGIDAKAQGLVEHAETIEHIGETRCWVSDLEQAWTNEIEANGAWSSATTRSGCSRPTFPPRRRRFGTSSPCQDIARAGRDSDSVVENTVKGRRGAGTQNHCMHGKDAVMRTSSTGARSITSP